MHLSSMACVRAGFAAATGRGRGAGGAGGPVPLGRGRRCGHEYMPLLTPSCNGWLACLMNVMLWLGVRSYSGGCMHMPHSI